MKLKPRSVKKISSQALLLSWNDDREDTISSGVLRRACPCASCMEKRGDKSHAAPLTGKPAKISQLNIISSSFEEELRLEEIWGVGNYAIGLKWGDGHASGIYSYELLRKLGEGG